uniref:Homologous recombination OB-fold protein OB-fold domain-containing protein n=1 Tax=Tanacetum cinerariifolium TaxID=118510 RepID=A0A6L2JJA8_TANCI|nr:hypothetical protein [Tanacetum cinerariifolium]
MVIPFFKVLRRLVFSRDAFCILSYPDVQHRLDGLTLTELTNFHDVAAVRFVMSNNLLTREAQALSAEEKSMLVDRSQALREVASSGIGVDLVDMKDFDPNAKQNYDRAIKSFYQVKFPYVDLLVRYAGHSVGKLMTLKPLIISFRNAFAIGPSASPFPLILSLLFYDNTRSCCIVQTTKLYKIADTQEGGEESVMSIQEYIRKAIEDVGEDDDFTCASWLNVVKYVNADGGIVTGCFGDVKKFLKNGKFERVVTVINSCTPNALGDLAVTLKDIYGIISSTIHYKVLTEDRIAKVITVGAALILHNIFVFFPK